MKAARLLLINTLLLAASAHAVTIEMMTIGNAGNLAQSSTNANQNGYGSVAYEYQIGKYEVTIGQYTAFLNAVAKVDTYSLYDTSMTSNRNGAGISRSGAIGSYEYSAIGPFGITPIGASSPDNRPITYVSWFDAARFANWMANGQPTGAQTSETTENGAYNVNGATSGTAPAKNGTNPNTGTAPAFYIPTENEWYKAAYYSPALSSGSGGYYTYATQSNTDPGNVVGSGANQAIYYAGDYAVTKSASYSASQNYLTDVGAFSGSGSFYGTFDQSGNVYEWNDLAGAAGSGRGLRGGSWYFGRLDLPSSKRLVFDASSVIIDGGFRLAAVPEPSTWASLLAGLACGGYSLFRRRKQA